MSMSKNKMVKSKFISESDPLKVHIVESKPAEVAFISRSEMSELLSRRSNETRSFHEMERFSFRVELPEIKLKTAASTT